MLDHALDELLLAHLKTVPALAALHGYTGQDNADHKLPALTIAATSEPLAGSDTAFRGEVGIIVESEAHDTTAAAHGERVEAVRAALRHAQNALCVGRGKGAVCGDAARVEWRTDSAQRQRQESEEEPDVRHR